MKVWHLLLIPAALFAGTLAAFFLYVPVISILFGLSVLAGFGLMYALGFSSGYGRRHEVRELHSQGRAHSH